MFMYSINIFNDIPIINHIFFEPGHSQMECDSVHAHIQSSTAKIEIYDPSAWYTAIRCAVRGDKYTVTEIDQEEIFDFKKMAKQLITNRKIDTDGNVVRWLDICWLQFRKTSTDEVFFKYDQKEDFKSFKLTRRGRRSFPGASNLTLESAYSEPLSIQQDKLNDLIGMCTDGTIKQQYHSFYHNLKGSSTREESEEDED
ncbi:uncharacterized protein LOC120355242 [Nilaparvata lugens]|uniref:uncharacterized protein LOC120355242 n=1 Tax=Nilaparvata lugens TaxID=108931 RepID=UPI00193E0D51|nr:uncharacterized protein LOC120355242 [Nilaparvata lugens]